MNSLIHEVGWRSALYCFFVGGISFASLLSLIRRTAQERQVQIQEGLNRAVRMEEAELNCALHAEEEPYDPGDIFLQAPAKSNRLLPRYLLIAAHALVVIASVSLGFPAMKSASYTHQGNQALREHDYETAVKRYTSALEASSSADYLVTQYKNSLAQNDAKGGEINRMRRLVDLHPGNEGIHNDLGNQLMARGALGNAIKEYRQAIALNPSDAIVHNNLGNALQASHQYPESIVEFRKAIHLDPNQIPTYYNLANTLMANGQTAEAVTDYQIAIDLNPTLTPAYYNLAQALAKQGKRTEAMTSLDSFLQIAPKHPEFKDVLAKAKTQLEDWRRAE